MTTPDIRPTEEQDIPALRDVIDQTELFPSEMLPDLLAPFLADADTALWLTASLNGRALALCYAVPEEMADGVWNMRALAVHPDAQGQRVGAALVGAAEDALRARGCRLLIVDTSGTEGFLRTRKFYAQNGYGEEARIRDFWSAGDDKVTFRKAL